MSNKKARRSKLPFPYVDIINNDRNGVTPSNTYIVINYMDYGEKKQSTIGIDCGTAQGKEAEKVGLGLKVEPFREKCKHYCITHAHVDHVGELVQLYVDMKKQGLEKDLKVYMTNGTYHYMPAVQRDNLKVKTTENEGKPPYSEKDIDDFLETCIPVNYNKPFILEPCVQAKFIVNRHILGAGMVLLEVLDSKTKVPVLSIIITGDYKFENVLEKFEKFPEELKHRPVYIILESTYAMTSKKTEVKKFRKVLTEFINENKDKAYFNVLIPAFSLETTPQILHEIRLMQKEGLIPSNIKIKLDGQLSQSHLRTVLKHSEDFLLKDDIEIIPEGLELVNGEERRNVVSNTSQKQIVVASGGMLQGASINYIVPWLQNSNTLVFPIGYKPEGTVGYQVANAKQGDTININNTELVVKAQVDWTREFSRHAKHEDLVKFIKSFDKILGLFIVHGEDNVREDFVNFVESNPAEFENVKTVINLNYKKKVRISQFKVEAILES